jgi:hypothetical protein
MAREHSQPQDVVLRRYRSDGDLWVGRPDMIGLPVTYHSAILARVKDELQAEGFVVIIDFTN